MMASGLLRSLRRDIAGSQHRFTLDLEGIVAKKAGSPYEENWSCPHWIKIKNPNYSQKEGRADLFKRAG